MGTAVLPSSPPKSTPDTELSHELEPHPSLWTAGFEVTAALAVCPAVGLEGPGVFPTGLAHGQGSQAGISETLC